MTENNKRKWEAYLVTIEDPYTPLYKMEISGVTPYQAKRAWFTKLKKRYPLPKDTTLVQLMKYIRLRSKEPRKEYTLKKEVG